MLDALEQLSDSCRSGRFMDAIESFGEVTIDGGFGIEVAQESTPGAGDFDANVLMAVEIQDDPDGIDSRARRLR